MQCDRRLQISRMKNIVNVFELSSMVFCCGSRYDGLFVSFWGDVFHFFTIVALLDVCNSTNKYFSYLHQVFSARRFTLMWWPASLSFLMNWGIRISRERFDLESSNSTGTSIQTGQTFAPYMTSLTASGRKLKPKKFSTVSPQMASGGFSRERFKRGSPDFIRLSLQICRMLRH